MHVIGNQDLVQYFANRYIYPDIHVLDIGGANLSTLPFSQKGANLTIVDIKPVNHPDVNYVQSFFEKFVPPHKFQAIWCSHVLEHVMNVNFFIRKIIEVSSDDAIIGIIVPPLKTNLVGGHINLFTPATLCYNIILAGQNLSKATVIKHKYNIAVFWQRFDWPLPPLKYDKDDIELLSNLFPKKVFQGINGDEGWDRIRANAFDDLLGDNSFS